MIRMRWRWQAYGPQIHVRVDTAPLPARDTEPASRLYASCGRLVFRSEEWADIMALLGPQVELIREDH
jgi:hypothetical protein